MTATWPARRRTHWASSWMDSDATSRGRGALECDTPCFMLRTGKAPGCAPASSCPLSLRCVTCLFSHTSSLHAQAQASWELV